MEIPLRPWLAFVWSFLMPGTGQLYNGQWRRALGAWALYVGLTLVVLCTLPLFVRGHLLGWIVFEEVMLRAGAGLDAWHGARQRRWTERRFYRHWFVLPCLRLAAWMGVGQVLRANSERLPVQTRFAVSNSMSPAVCTGDYVMAQTYYYRSHAPQVGEVVLFDAPHGESENVLLKRIFAVAGDRVSLRKGALLRNGSPVFTGVEGELDEVLVPADSVYMVGDNVNNSADSRVFGAVPTSHLKGRVLQIILPSARAGPVGSPTGQ